MKEKLKEYLVQNLDFLPPELIVLIVSAMPIVELRGGLPLAYIHYDFSLVKSFVLSVIGNLLPLIPLLLLFQPISKWLMRFGLYRKMYDWLYNRTLKKSNSIEKYGAIGLMLFTALPLPTTGAYSACVAASIFLIRMRYAFISIALGVVIAAIIVSFGMFSISIL
ncbi:small multi-drug export protein [Cytobacillus sp. S13-E01]|uniref:COG2426 family protein n=1 Tax=Cytobacillus sp. S13-E01 TaxID=3031326 RepID=UPI0023D892DB|nr:small multi-drug export protein [Cytobacillus sp. S13-E01]MDF0726799.1 small multi-drug export protein [Cytobacillus sp. S13-E01]